MRIFLIFLSTLFTLKSSAGLDDKVKQWFNENNYSNSTSAHYYQAQSAQYITAPSYVERNEVMEFPQLLSVQAPKMSAGCGGIDLYMGGLQAVNADKFLGALRAIGQNSKTLAFMLALKTVTPMIENVINEVQHFSNQYLNMNMNSCKAAQALVGGVMGQMGKRNANCIVSTIESTGVSWQKAEEICGQGGQMSAVEGAEPNKIDFIKGNLAWYILMQEPYFSSDLEFAQIVMNITGTVIISGDDKSEFRVIPSSLKDKFTSDRFNNIYNAILEGKDTAGKKQELKIYRCSELKNDPYGCMVISQIPEVTSTNFEGLKTQVEKIFSSIASKILKDEALSPTEIGLINSTSIPVYKLLVSSLGAFPNTGIVERNIKDYTRLVAEDLLLKSLKTVISKVEMAASNPKNIKGSSQIKEYKEDLMAVLGGLEEKSKDVKAISNQRLELQMMIRDYEKTILGRLNTNIINNLSWSAQ